MTRPYVLPVGELQIRRGLKSITDYDALPGDYDYMRLMKLVFADLEVFVRHHQKAVENYEDGAMVDAAKQARLAAEAMFAVAEHQANLATAFESLPDKPIHPEYRHPEESGLQLDVSA